MARLDALQLARDLKQRVLDFSQTESYLRDDRLRELAAELWSGPPEEGGLLTDLWVEASWPARLSPDTTDSLARDGLFPADLAEHLDRNGALPLHRPLYTHQAEALRTARQGRPAVLITAGTGAGKTESFLLPTLAELWSTRAESTGIRALILYPMNALVNDQVDRLYRWLAGQRRLRFAHFTGETPEDGAKASKQGFTKGEPARCRSRQEARGLEDSQGRAVKPESRLPVPDILVTNYSMLEYMLARPQDAVFFGPNLQTVILDEAHLYTGTLAAEITLLLRRLLHRCRRSAEEVLQLATSATIGQGEDEELREFAGALFSKTDIRIVKGQEAPAAYPEPPPPPPPHDPAPLCERPDFPTIRLLKDREELVLDPEQARELQEHLSALVDSEPPDPNEPLACQLHATLRHAPVLHELDRLLRRQRFQPLVNLAGSLFGGHPRAQDATLRLLALAAAARTDLSALPLLPHRLHLMARASEGFSCCLNARCSGPAEHSWAGLGPVQAGVSDTCRHCGSLALTLMRCGNCGEAALGASSQGGTLSPYQPRPWDETPPRLLLAPAGPGRKVSIDPEKRRLLGHGQEGAELVELERCPNCTEKKKSVFKSLASPGNLLTSIMAETILAGVPPLVGSQVASSAILPARGRRMLAFSDSRAEAARLGPRLRRQHELQIIRTALVELLEKEVGPDQGLLSLLEDQVKIIQGELEGGQLSPAVADYRRKELDRIRLNLQTAREGGALGEWADRLARHELLHELLDPRAGAQHEVAKWSQWTWEDNADHVRKECLLRLGLELASPDRRQVGNLESIGWAEVGYPGLSRLEPPAGLLGELPRVARDHLRDGWTDLLAALLDTLRQAHAITLGTRELDQEWQQGSFPFGLWMTAEDFVGRTERKQRRDFVSDVLMQCSLERDQASDWAARVLEQIFAQLFEQARERRQEAGAHQLPWLEAWDGYQVDGSPTRALRLRFPELTMRRPLQLFRCATTGRIWGRSVLGCAPDTGSRGTLVPVTPEVLDQTPPVARSRREYRTSPVFRMGLWAEEHSAQLSAREGRRLQELFRAGMRNLLSATTTMELGIDIGGLSAAFLSNVPPGKANYLQRAGRVGRRADGSSVVVTAARSRPYDREVFLRLGEFLDAQLRRPRVFLERPRVVQRHLHAWLMGTFFSQLYLPGQHVGAMSAFGQMGTFCGRSLPLRWETASVPRPPLPEPPAALPQGFPIPPWWRESPEPGLHQAFLTWLAHVRDDRGELREALTQLFAGTVLRIESEWDSLFDQAEATFNEAVKRWMDDYDPLIETWIEAARPSQAAAVRYQAMSLYQTTVIESLSDAQFLPRYGFPIGLLKLRVVVKEDRRVREEDQFRLERSGLLALGEYVPGSQLLVGGRLITSRGLLKHWTGENLDQAFGLRGSITRCPNDHEYYWLTREPDACPVCGEEDRSSVQSLLFPRHGFTTADWDPPRFSTDTERVGSVKLDSITFSQGDDQAREESFAGISGLLARYRENGELLVTNRGEHDCGFAICTVCGYADSERRTGQGHDQLPPRFASHLPLYRSAGEPCWRSGEAHVLRNQVLAAHQPTDVLLLDFSEVLGTKCRRPELMITLGLALQLAGARLLDLDSRELGVLVVPIRLERLGPVLFDNVPGGAGHVLELMKQGREWLRQARQRLWVSQEHHQRCRSACLDCLMSIDAQHRLQSLEPRRREALELLDQMLGVTV